MKNVCQNVSKSNAEEIIFMSFTYDVSCKQSIAITVSNMQMVRSYTMIKTIKLLMISKKKTNCGAINSKCNKW